MQTCNHETLSWGVQWKWTLNLFLAAVFKDIFTLGADGTQQIWDFPQANLGARCDVLFATVRKTRVCIVFFLLLKRVGGLGAGLRICSTEQ